MKEIMFPLLIGVNVLKLPDYAVLQRVSVADGSKGGLYEPERLHPPAHLFHLPGSHVFLHVSLAGLPVCERTFCVLSCTAKIAPAVAREMTCLGTAGHLRVFEYHAPETRYKNLGLPRKGHGDIQYMRRRLAEGIKMSAGQKFMYHPYGGWDLIPDVVIDELKQLHWSAEFVPTPPNGGGGFYWIIPEGQAQGL